MMRIWGPGKTEFRFFWSREVADFVTVDAARARVDRDLNDREVMVRLRALLWRVSGLSMQDKELAAEIARLLARGKLVTKRAGPLDPYWLCEFGFQDKNLALQFLQRFQRDPGIMSGFRILFRESSSDSAIHGVTDPEVLDGLTKLLRAGTLLVGFWEPPGGSFSGTEPAPAGSDDWPSAPSPRSSAPPSDEESPTFSPGTALVAQAAALTSAARNGAPFCPE
jgi:hypothetical protein